MGIPMVPNPMNPTRSRIRLSLWVAVDHRRGYQDRRRRWVVPGEGVEPSWAFAQRFLRPSRLPVPPSRQGGRASVANPGRAAQVLANLDKFGGERYSQLSRWGCSSVGRAQG